MTANLRISRPCCGETTEHSRDGCATLGALCSPKIISLSRLWGLFPVTPPLLRRLWTYAVPAVLGGLLLAGPGWVVLPGSVSVQAFFAGLYLLLMGAGVWAMVAYGAVPVAARGLRITWRSIRRPWLRWLFAVAAVMALLAYPLRATRAQGWNASKWFDDTMAMSNPHKFLNSGNDPDSLYFRSFLRPAFTGFALPLALLAPMPNYTITLSPSDNFRRVWHIHHENGSFPENRPTNNSFPLISNTVRMLLCAVPVILFGILVCLGIGPWSALIAAPLLLYWHLNCIEELVTQSFNMVVVVLMLAVVVRLMRHPDSVRGHALAGAGLAVGFLTIHSMAVAILPMMILLIWRAHLARRPLRDCLPLVTLAAAFFAGILLWYEGFLQGFLYEQLQFINEQEETQFLMSYPQNTIREMVHRLDYILKWTFWPVVVSAGVALVAVFWSRRMAPVMVLWIGLSVAAIASQDYIFFRFYLYGFPALAWVLGFALDRVGGGVRMAVGKVGRLLK
jgi:hypothetical protein